MKESIRGGAWIAREGDYLLSIPRLMKSPWSNQWILDICYRHIVISWWRTNQLTLEEQEREEQDNWQYWEEWRKEQEAKADLERKHD